MKIADKLKEVNEEVNIYRYDNGYTVKISGKQDEDEWGDVKIVCNTLDEVIILLKEYSLMKISD